MACQSCLNLNYNARSLYDDDIWKKAGEVNAMFNRIVMEEEFQKYSPTILSRPKEEQEGVVRAGDNDDDGPWVVMLEDVLTEHECQTLIELGYKEGYEISANAGKPKSDDGGIEEKN